MGIIILLWTGKGEKHRGQEKTGQIEKGKIISRVERSGFELKTSELQNHSIVSIKTQTKNIVLVLI